MENKPVRRSVIFCATDGALALLEVLHFISLRRLCSRPNARSFSPPGLVGRRVGCAATFGFFFVARGPPFPVIFGFGASERLAAPFSLYLVAGGFARLGEETKRRAASRKFKARIVASLEPISVDDSRARPAIFCSRLQSGETKKKGEKSESPELVSRGERSGPPCWIDAPILVVCDFLSAL